MYKNNKPRPFMYKQEMSKVLVKYLYTQHTPVFPVTTISTTEKMCNFTLKNRKLMFVRWIKNVSVFCVKGEVENKA